MTPSTPNGFTDHLKMKTSPLLSWPVPTSFLLYCPPQTMAQVLTEYKIHLPYYPFSGHRAFIIITENLNVPFDVIQLGTLRG